MPTCDNSVGVNKINIIIRLLTDVESFTSEESRVWGLSQISGGMPSYTVLFFTVA